MKKRKLVTSFMCVLALWIICAQLIMKKRTSDEEAKKFFDRKGIDVRFGNFHVHGARLHYAQTGDDHKPTLFFLHGSPGSWTAFREYMKDKELLQHFRMISIDRPGFGYSDFGHFAGLNRQSELIAPLLAALQNGKPFYVVGHSLGGALAVKLAANFSRYINGLLLLAASVDPGLEKKERWRAVAGMFPFRYLIPGAMRPSNAELWAFKKEVRALPADLHQVQCSVVILQGSEDSLVPPENAVYAQKELTKASSVKLIRLDGADHFFHRNRYQIVKEVILTRWGRD